MPAEKAASKPPKGPRRPLAVNVYIDGHGWFGPHYGNEADYPDGLELGEHLFDPPEG